ncbi:MAG: hypothetical protein ABIH45_06790 [Candidatus Omnitrophota bacterium]
MNNKRLYHFAELSEIFYGVIVTAVVLVVIIAIYGFLFGDANFTLPKAPPITEGYDKGDLWNFYSIIYNDNFEGLVSYFGAGDLNIEFIIKNSSKKSYDFKKAKFWLWTHSGEEHRLELEESNNNYILNPKMEIVYLCKIPKSMPLVEDIKGFSISGVTRQPIRFGYAKLSLWDKGRWWLAGKIREYKTKK